MTKILIFLVAIQGILGGVIIRDEYIDRLIFNSDSVEDTESNEDNESYNFSYENGMWTCGNCDVIDETKMIYSDALDVDTNITEGQGVNLGMALALDDMECVAVTAAVSNMVRRISGSCVGPTITIDVYQARRVKVNVYGK
ncbi:uncharacterized protein LOC126368507 isoform X2 [Pectinophora gossypiella]|uniref:uncharacterized protein LOC126368507 isoform X2 n=1 Tax=Pectinophora gossypiella TaxID=13191 RepID=UPI00214E4BE4|nr:uncharacterized protein LOC126368507 isoform X2 [Pectinophora gossypiella]